MLHITLGADDLVAVAYERYHHPEPIVQRKMTVLWLKQQGLPHHEIARLAGVSWASVTRYLQRVLPQGGLDAIRRFPWKGRRGQLDDHWVSLEEHFRQHPPRSLRQAQQTIEQRDRPAPRPDSGSAFPAAAGAQAKRKVAAVPLPPKSTLPEHVREQRRFLDDELEPQLREARAGLRDVYFVDASHFVFGSFLGYVWCFVRLCIRAASGRQALQRAGGVARRQPPVDPVVNHSYINATSVCDLLRAVAAASVGRPITLVLDECPLPEMRPGPGVGPILENPSAVPAFLFAEPEPDRAGVEVRQERMRLQSVQHASYEAFTAAIDNCLAKPLSTTHKKDKKTLLAHKFQMFDSVSMVAARWTSSSGNTMPLYPSNHAAGSIVHASRTRLRPSDPSASARTRVRHAVRMASR